MNHPHHFKGDVTEHLPCSSKYSFKGNRSFLSGSGTNPLLFLRTQESGSDSRSSVGFQTSSPTIRYPSVLFTSSESPSSSSSSVTSLNSRGSSWLPFLDTQINE